MPVEQLDFFGEESSKEARMRRAMGKLVAREKAISEEERKRRLVEKKNPPTGGEGHVKAGTEPKTTQ